MKMRRGILLLTVAAQLVFAVGMIWRAEDALRGTAYLFQTAPVDPVDWMRGRYVRLAFPLVSVPFAAGTQPVAGKQGFATLAVGEQGYARMVELHPEPPAGVDSLRVDVVRVRRKTASVRLPFDRFYMDEQRAPEVDALMAQQRGRAAVVIRVHEGEGVIERLEVEGLDSGRDLPLRERLSTAPGVVVPEALVAAIEKSGPPNLPLCGASVPCVVFPVELSDAASEEYVVQGPSRQLHYYVAEGEDATAFRWRAVLHPRQGGTSPSGAELLALLAQPDEVRASAPEYRDLQLGRSRLAVPH